jgi:hypothetical protein
MRDAGEFASSFVPAKGVVQHPAEHTGRNGTGHPSERTLKRTPHAFPKRPRDAASGAADVPVARIGTIARIAQQPDHVGAAVRFVHQNVFGAHDRHAGAPAVSGPTNDARTIAQRDQRDWISMPDATINRTGECAGR